VIEAGCIDPPICRGCRWLAAADGDEGAGRRADGKEGAPRGWVDGDGPTPNWYEAASTRAGERADRDGTRGGWPWGLVWNEPAAPRRRSQMGEERLRSGEATTVGRQSSGERTPKVGYMGRS
jgi:hypothetical protein